MSDEADFEAGHQRYRTARREIVAAHYNRIIACAPATSTPITFYAEVTVDDYETVRIGEWGGYYLQVMPMAFNNRLVMAPMNFPGVYDFGWCYQKGSAAVLAAMAWNPQSQDEPLGFIKRVGSKRVKAQRAVMDAQAGAVTTALLRHLGLVSEA